MQLMVAHLDGRDESQKSEGKNKKYIITAIKMLGNVLCVLYKQHTCVLFEIIPYQHHIFVKT